MADSRRIYQCLERQFGIIWQSKQHQILQLFGWEVSRLSCLAGKQIDFKFDNASDSAQVMAGLSPFVDKTRIYKTRGKCATQYFICLYFVRTLKQSQVSKTKHPQPFW